MSPHGRLIESIDAPDDVRVRYYDGTESKINLDDLYLAFDSSCLSCLDYSNRLADLTVGRAGSPAGFETVLIRTEAGLRALEGAATKGEYLLDWVPRLRAGVPRGVRGDPPRRGGREGPIQGTTLSEDRSPGRSAPPLPALRGILLKEPVPEADLERLEGARSRGTPGSHQGTRATRRRLRDSRGHGRLIGREGPSETQWGLQRRVGERSSRPPDGHLDQPHRTAHF